MHADNRLQQLLDAIDTCNRQDPNQELAAGKPWPKALLYGHRMSAALADFEPDATEELQIACRAQHIERWCIPRNNYSMDRVGYLTWRRELGKFHADRTAELMKDLDYDESQIALVRKLVTKQGIKQDPMAQTLEDVICLVFVKFYLADFANTQNPDKLLSIIRKTWAKMSDRGQQKILTLQLDPVLESTLKKALAD